MGLELPDFSYSPSSLCSCQIKLFTDRLTKKNGCGTQCNPVIRSFGFKSGFRCFHCFRGNVRDPRNVIPSGLGFISKKQKVGLANLYGQTVLVLTGHNSKMSDIHILYDQMQGERKLTS